MTTTRFFQVRIVLGLMAISFWCIGGLYAAPLESGFALAPSASASPGEKAAAYQEARNRLLSTAGKYDHTPYRYGGIDRKGLDCSGLVYLSFHEALGISVPRDSGSLYSWVEKIQIERAQPGDLVFFNTTGNGKVSHVGIFVGNGRFIHSASEGPVTGVMYSSLDERYWARTYAGAGRALPPTNVGGGAYNQAVPTLTGATTPTAAIVTDPPKTGNGSPAGYTPETTDSLLVGFAIAPSWNTSFSGNNIMRGAAGQVRVAAEVRPFGKSMVIGLELRPEWDGVLGVFRLPLTLSWGLNDNLRFFLGPAFSFGNASLNVSGESRQYSAGASWIGAAGITYAPIRFQIGGSELMPYAEMAWQSYVNNNDGSNFGADFAAGFRFSTGIRCSWRIN